MLSDLLRILVAIADYKYWLGYLFRKNKIDILFISNIRSDVDRKGLTGLFNAGAHHFGLVRLWLNSITGHVRVINTTYEEIMSKDGIKKAKSQALDAIRWADRRGVRVVLFASSTKRLFSSNELKQIFPDIVFSLGDNGTSYILQAEVVEILSRLKMNIKDIKVCVVGANGFIGETMVDFFVKNGSHVVGVGSSLPRLNNLAKKYPIEITDSIDSVVDVDVVVACTHFMSSRLSSSNIDNIRAKDKKLLIFDMAQPPNLEEVEYEKCADVVVRLDSADAFSPKLKHVLGRLVGYKRLGVSAHVTFGCFSEAIVLASLLKKRKKVSFVLNMNHFEVNNENVEKIKSFYALSKTDLSYQEPHCYSKKIENLSLDLD